VVTVTGVDRRPWATLMVIVRRYPAVLATAVSSPVFGLRQNRVTVCGPGPPAGAVRLASKNSSPSLPANPFGSVYGSATASQVTTTRSDHENEGDGDGDGDGEGDAVGDGDGPAVGGLTGEPGKHQGSSGPPSTRTTVPDTAAAGERLTDGGVLAFPTMAGPLT
jgi:hypothetical protein